MKNTRHILALSGGKDSAALAVYMREYRPDLKLEYVFTDSGCELPETYEYLNRIRALLNIDIIVIKPERNFDYWLKYYKGVLPSPQSRWCTRHLKLIPYEAYLKNTFAYSYVAIRADEDREGYKSTTGNVVTAFPFVEQGITLSDVKSILVDSGLGLPNYYKWRSRSGCYFCFYQTIQEWVDLRKHHPELFEAACAYEESHDDGREYTWLGVRGGKRQYLRFLDDYCPTKSHRESKQANKAKLRETLNSVTTQDSVKISVR